MEQVKTTNNKNNTVSLNKVRTYFSKPQNIILLLFGIVLTFTTFAPVVAIVRDTIIIHPGTIDAHLTGKVSGYTLVNYICLLYTSPSPRDGLLSRMPSSA